MEPILEAKKLNLWYGPNHALHDVSIAIPEHEITAFIGPSGCGKSTFLRTLNRMNDLIPGVKLSGEVDFHGQDLYGSSVDPTWLRKQIGMVFQKANPFPMSIYDNVAYDPRHPKPGEAGRDRGELSAFRRHLGRGKGPAEEKRLGAFRRSAAAAVHRPGFGGGAGGAADGRIHQRSGPHLHL